MRTARDLSLMLLLLLVAAAPRTARAAAISSVLRRHSRRRSASRRVVPGFRVTRLHDPVTKKYVWGTPCATMHTEYEGNLDLPRPAVSVTTIAGDCVPTAIRILSRADGTLAFYPDELRTTETSLGATLFEPGDGTVPISSAAPGGAAVLFCDGHQGIATDPNVHRTLIRQLRR